MAKKDFFKEATLAEIKKKSIVDMPIQFLPQYAYASINSFLPTLRSDYDSDRKFMKHGPEVKLKRVYTIKDAVEQLKTPVQLREEAFNSISDPFFCGYSFMPIGRDKRKRKVALIECLEGARIFAYMNKNSDKSEKSIIKPYSDAQRVRKDGAEVFARIPSRDKRQKTIDLKLTSVPIIDSPEKYAIALNIGSDHSCPSKRFNIRYKYIDDKESSGVVNMCAHEIATYLALIQQEWNENKNIIPLQMCQFAIPTQFTVDYYLKLNNNVLVDDPKISGKDKLRKPRRAEKEMLLWALVKEFGHDKTFFSRASRDGDIANYKWK